MRKFFSRSRGSASRLAILAAATVACTPVVSLAQTLSQWTFENVATASSVASNLSASDFSVQGGSLSYQTGNGGNIGFAASWSTSATFSSSGKYWQFSITPAAGYAVDLSGLAWKGGRTSAGPAKAQLQFSLDGFATAGTNAGAEATITSTSTTTLDSFSLADSDFFAGSTSSTVTFRLFGYAASGTGNFRIDDVVISGTVAPVVSSTNWAGTGGGGTWQTGATGNFGGAYTDSTTNTVTFGGTAEAVAVSGTVVAGNLQFNTASYTLSNGTISLGAAAGAGGNITTPASGTTTINSVIAGTSTNVTKLGAGTLVLGGANTFTGQLRVQAGTLEVGTFNGQSVDGPLGNSTSAVSLGNTGGVTGTLRYTGSNAASNKGIALATGGTGALDITQSTTEVTLGGLVSGSGGLSKLGAGTLTLSNSNTFTGGLSIGAGVVQLNNAGALNSTAGSENAVSFAASSTGTLRINGNSIVVASLNSNATPGTPTVENGGAANATLTVGNSTNAASTYAGLLQNGTGGGTLAVTKVGTGTLTLSNTANSYSGGTTVGGGTLALGGDGVLGTGPLTFGQTGTSAITIQSTDSAARTVANSLGTIVGSGLNITFGQTSGGTGTLNFTDTTAVSLGASGPTRTFTVNTTTTFAAGFTGSGAVLTKAGTGNLILNGTNTFTGGTNINAGTLTLGGSLSATGTVAIATAGTLAGTGTLNGNATITGSGNINFSAGGNIVGTLTATGGNWIGGGTVTGAVTNATNAFTIGTGANLTASSGLTINSGTLASGATSSTLTGSLTYNSTVTSSFTGVLAGTGASLTITAGQLTLGSANTYTGATSVSGGTLVVPNVVVATGASGLGNATSAVTLGSATTAGTLSYSGTTATFTRGLTIGGAGGGVLTVSTSGQTLTVGTNGVTGTGLFTVNGSGNATFNAALSHTGGLTKSGSGTVTLAAANTYTGTTTLLLGTLTLDANDALPTTSVPVLGDSAGVSSAATLTLAANRTQNVAGLQIIGPTGSANPTRVSLGSGSSLVVNGDIAYETGSNNRFPASITGAGTLDLGGAVRTFTVWDNNNTSNGDFQVASAIVNGGITKAQGGYLVLSGNNTYAGATTVNAGALRASSANALGSTASGTTVATGAALEVSGGIVIPAEPLSLNGTGISSAGALRNLSGTNTFGGPITLQSASSILSDAGTLTLDVASGDAVAGGFALTLGGVGGVTVNDAINIGASTLTKSGTGTLILAADSPNFTGSTTISSSGGVVRITSGGALGGTANGTTVNSTSALQLSGGITTLAEPLSLGSTGVSTDGGLRNFSGTNTYAGQITIAANSRIQADSGTSLVLDVASGSAITGSPSATLTFGGAGTITVNDPISTGVTVSITKADAGTLILAGSNDFAGTIATATSGGVINIRNGNALGLTSASTTIASGTALEIQGGITTAAEPLNLTGTGISTGGALRNVSGNNTYAGAIALGGATRINSDAGTLTIDVASGNAITGTSSTLTVGGAGNTTIADPVSLGTGGLTKADAGVLRLNANNSYSGTTTVSGGVVVLGSATALPGGIGSTGGTSGLTVNGGGVVGLGSGNFSRALGTGVAQVQFTGSGGFAAYGADRTVNLGGATAEVAWATSSFVPSGSSFVLGAASADATVTFQNPLNLASSATSRTLQVDDGSAAVDAVMSGVIRNGSSSSTTLAIVQKTGTGTLRLTGNNTYAGTTSVTAGALIVDGIHSGDGTVTGSNVGAYSVSNATVGGVGTVKASVDIGANGTLAPGTAAGPGTFTTNNVSFVSSATFTLEIGDTAGGTDKLATGTFDVGTLGQPTLTLTYVGTQPGGPVSYSYTIVDGASLVLPSGGAKPFSNLGASLGANRWAVNQPGFNGDVFFDTANGDVVLNLTSVPEPGTLSLLALGALPLLRRRRRARA
jgi:autotransporter-associated beta strand protein